MLDRSTLAISKHVCRKGGGVKALRRDPPHLFIYHLIPSLSLDFRRRGSPPGSILSVDRRRCACGPKCVHMGPRVWPTCVTRPIVNGLSTRGVSFQHGDWGVASKVRVALSYLVCHNAIVRLFFEQLFGGWIFQEPLQILFRFLSMGGVIIHFNGWCHIFDCATVLF